MIERLTGANHKELGFHTYIGAKNPYSAALTLGELLLNNTNPKYRPREILNDVFDRLAAYEDSGLSPEEVQELAKAKADGRLKILPAKPGDIIYRPEALQFCWVITKVEIYEDEIVFIDDSDNIFRPDDIGKTVFLSREEAEKALQEGLR